MIALLLSLAAPVLAPHVAVRAQARILPTIRVNGAGLQAGQDLPLLTRRDILDPATGKPLRLVDFQ